MTRFSAAEAEAANESWGDPGVEYRAVADFPDYVVGDDGTLWSRHAGSWKRLRPRSSRGYAMARLCRDGVIKYRKLHLLIMEAFVGPRPAGLEVAHNDGNGLNARLSNLRYDTHIGNHQDRIRHGTSNAGHKNGMSRLTEDAVREIRRRVDSGEDKNAVAHAFQIQVRQVNRVVRGYRWGHVR